MIWIFSKKHKMNNELLQKIKAEFSTAKQKLIKKQPGLLIRVAVV